MCLKQVVLSATDAGGTENRDEARNRKQLKDILPYSVYISLRISKAKRVQRHARLFRCTSDASMNMHKYQLTPYIMLNDAA